MSFINELCTLIVAVKIVEQGSGSGNPEMTDICTVFYQENDLIRIL